MRNAFFQLFIFLKSYIHVTCMTFFTVHLQREFFLVQHALYSGSISIRITLNVSVSLFSLFSFLFEEVLVVKGTRQGFFYICDDDALNTSDITHA